ncbi:MAG: ABC transporter permease [Tuberibacillus sp.]
MRWISLVHNESLKIYKRKMLWIMVAILAAVSILMAIVMLKVTPDHTDWKKDLQTQNAQMQSDMNDESVPKEFRVNLSPQINVNHYRIEHDIPPVYGDTVLGFIDSTRELISVLIGVFVVIIGGSIVSQEYSWGTIKLLMIRPIQRWKILLSKLIAIILTGVFFILAGFILQFIIGSLFFGFDMGSGKYLYDVDGTIHVVTMGKHLLEVYASNLVDVIIMATFAFMLSTIFKSNALAIGLSIFLSLAGPIVVSILSQLNVNIAKYLFFLNTDLYQYVEGQSMLEGTTMGFSITVLLIYFIIFLAVSFAIFGKRDIAE